MVRQKEAVRPGHEQSFTQGSIIGRHSEELVVGTQVGVSVATVFAVAARHGGLDRDALAGGEWLAGFGLGSGPGGDHGAGKFMAQSKGLLGYAAANAARLIHVEVGAADTDGVDFEENLIGDGSGGSRLVAGAKVEGSMEADGAHESGGQN